jgi:sugar lactone lactonase YvrE
VRITSAGRIVQIAGGLKGPHDLESDAHGNLYVAETGRNRIAQITPNRVVRSYIDGLNTPVDLAFNPQGELLVCEFSGERVIAFKSPTDKRIVISGFRPHGLAFPRSGATIVNDITGSRVVRVSPDGKVDVIATKVELPIGVVIGPSGDLYVAARNAGQLLRITLSGSRTVLLYGLTTPRDPAFNA